MAFFHVVDARSGVVALETDPVMENQTEAIVGRSDTKNIVMGCQTKATH